MQVHYRLAFDDHGYPGLYVFSNCKAFIRTMPLLQYDDVNPEDVDTNGEDHVADEVRYFCMSRPVKPAAEVAANEPDSLSLFLDIPMQDRAVILKRPKMEVINE
jgi:hypothetical protein